MEQHQQSSNSGAKTPTELLSDSSTSLAVEPIATSVKQFLALRNGDNDSHPTGVVMNKLSVHGSGTGVRNKNSSSCDSECVDLTNVTGLASAHCSFGG